MKIPIPQNAWWKNVTTETVTMNQEKRPDSPLTTSGLGSLKGNCLFSPTFSIFLETLSFMETEDMDIVSALVSTATFDALYLVGGFTRISDLCTTTFNHRH